jgi:hypothetical protein
MCALGQKQTSGRLRIMSALPPKADIVERSHQSALCIAISSRRPLTSMEIDALRGSTTRVDLPQCRPRGSSILVVDATGIPQ